MKTIPTRLVSALSLRRRTVEASSSGMLLQPASASCCLVLVAVLALLGWVDRAAGQIPDRLSFQGYLEDASSVPLGQASPANFAVAFRVFPGSTGGAILWSESQNVTFDKGNYSVLLGQGAQVGSEPHGALSNVVINAGSSELYVETWVTLNGTPTKILPRLQLLPTPYAFLATKALTAASAVTAASATTALNANRATSAGTADTATRALTADTAALATNALSANTVPSLPGAKIVDASVTQNKLEASIVTSLTGPIADNRLTANVALRNASNNFTGNQTITGNATVTGNLNLGSVGQLKVAAGSESLRIVRGQVRVNGVDPNFTASAIPPGTFTAVRRSNVTINGTFFPNTTYEVTFTTPFLDTPSVTVSPYYDPSSSIPNKDVHAKVTFCSPTNAQFYVIWPGQSAGVDFPVNFIAVGAR